MIKDLKISNDLKFFPCDCYSHAIGIWHDMEDSQDTETYFSFWEKPFNRDDLWHRIKGAWKFLKGDPWKDEVCMNNEGLKEFIRHLELIVKNNEIVSKS